MFAEHSISADDFDNICRFCLAIQQADVPIKFNPIFKENGIPVNRALLKMITACLGLDVSKFIYFLYTFIYMHPVGVMYAFSFHFVTRQCDKYHISYIIHHYGSKRTLTHIQLISITYLTHRIYQQQMVYHKMCAPPASNNC